MRGANAWRVTSGLAVLWLLLWGAYLWRSDYFALATGVQDDTYYYLLPAWNASRLGWFTFDGLTTAYGFQPLWELCLAAAAYLLPSREALLRASLLLGAGCYALTAVGIGRASSLLCRRDGRSGGAWAATAAAGMLLINAPVQLSNLTGKENALYGLLFVVLLNVRLAEHARNREPRPFLCGALAGLILLARLTPMSLAVVAIQPWWPGHRWTRRGFAVRYAAAALLVIAPWAVFATLAFGSPLPTSASVRTEGVGAYLSSGGPGLFAGMRAVGAYLDACVRFSLGLGSSFWAAPHRFDLVGWLLMPLLVLAGLASAITGSVERRPGQGWAMRPETHVVALLVAVVTATTVIPILLSRDPADMYYRRWYVVELPLLAALLGGVGAERIAAWACRTRALCASLAALCLAWGVAGALETALLAKPVVAYVDRGRWQDVTLRATLWSNRELSLTRENRIGAFSAGLLGWLSTATVVNLDGLANDEVARAFGAKWSIDRYCASRGITLYADAVDPALLFGRYATRLTVPNNSPEFPTYYVAEIGSAPSAR